MKTRFISHLLLLFLLSGCSNFEKIASQNSIEITKATYQQWYSVSPETGEPSERGIDLVISVNNFPVDAEPLYIIYNNHRSFLPDYSTTEENKILIEARIILESGLLVDVSNNDDLSDRFVFKTKDGDIQHREIHIWEQLSNRVL